MGTELVKSGGMQLTPLDSQVVIKGICSMMDLDTIEQAAVVLLTCTQDQITPVDFMRRYHIVKGKPTLQAKTMLADLRKMGAKHKMIESSPVRACIEIEFEGNTSTFEITWEQAKASRWPWKNKDRKDLKDNWSTDMDREDMLWSRVIKRAVDRLAPEISHGMYTPEETEDYLSTPEGMEPTSLVETPATVENNEIEAEYEVKEDPKEEQAEQQAEQQAEEAEAPIADSEWSAIPALVPDDTISGNCTKKDRAKIRDLIKKLLDADRVAATDVQQNIEQRGVTAINQFSKEQAAEVIVNLEGLVADL